MAQTLVRIFYDDAEIKGVVIPDHDDELDLHHKVLVDAPHTYVDLKTEKYLEFALDDGLPHPAKLLAYVKSL